MVWGVIVSWILQQFGCFHHRRSMVCGQHLEKLTSWKAEVSWFLFSNPSGREPGTFALGIRNSQTKKKPLPIWPTHVGLIWKRKNLGGGVMPYPRPPDLTFLDISCYCKNAELQATRSWQMIRVITLGTVIWARHCIGDLSLRPISTPWPRNPGNQSKTATWATHWGKGKGQLIWKVDIFFSDGNFAEAFHVYAVEWNKDGFM